MKVCFVTTVYNTLNGFVLNYAKFLHENTDWEITFICNYDKEFADSLPEYIRFIPVKMERGFSFTSVGAVVNLTKIFKKEKFDIIQYSTPNASFYSSVASFLTKTPVRLYCQWGLAFEGFSGIKRIFLKTLEKATCRFSTDIEPDSFGNLNYCRDLGFYSEKKSRVVHFGSAAGVSLDKFDISKKEEYSKEIRKQYNIPSNAFVFGFVGAITGDKGINELLSATKNILQKYPDIYLMLVGTTEKEYSLDADLLNWSNDCNNVIYCGRSFTVEKNMAAMDCYVTASYREGFGTTVIEAGAMGLPVITSNIPGPTDAITDEYNGLIVNKKDYIDLAKGMEKMYLNRDLCKEYGKKAYDNVCLKYDRKVLFEKILEDRKKLLNII